MWRSPAPRRSFGGDRLGEDTQRHLTNSAYLIGTANPNGAATLAWFRYSTVSPGTCNDSFGTRAPLPR